MTQLATVVHTTGINWEGWGATVGTLGVFLLLVGGLIVRQLRQSITDVVKDVIAKTVLPTLSDIEATLRDHNARIARLEGYEAGRRERPAP